VFCPEAIVFQAGADSLSGDRLGCFNLSIRGHAECLKYMQTFNVPMIVLGGGGYTIRNVARCWAYETGCLLGVDMNDMMPANDYSEYFGPTHQLHIQTSNMENQNTSEYLHGIRNRILEHLSQLQTPSGISFHEAPRINSTVVGSDTHAQCDEDKPETGRHAGQKVGRVTQEDFSLRLADRLRTEDKESELPRSVCSHMSVDAINSTRSFELPGQGKVVGEPTYNTTDVPTKTSSK
jgi:histone deacetylase 1/2